MRSVAVVIPIYRGALSADEKISLCHAEKYLGAYNVIVAAPEGLEVPFRGHRVERFDKADFASLEAYNRLLLAERFYRRFSEYEFILIYQLDCLVLSDELDKWCCDEWDYIGAPWLTDFASTAEGGAELWRVGNGGFSLRRVSSFLRVFQEYGHWAAASIYYSQSIRPASVLGKIARLPKILCQYVLSRDPLAKHLERNLIMEDWFWGVEAPHFLPGFRVPPVDIALRFAFEVDPKFCYAQNSSKLPFGVHAWARYDREFWEKRIAV